MGLWLRQVPRMRIEEWGLRTLCLIQGSSLNKLKNWAALRWARFTCPADREPRLGVARAVWRSLWGCPTDFHPRVHGSQESLQTLDTDAMLQELGGATRAWTAIQAGDGKVLNDAIGLARQ